MADRIITVTEPSVVTNDTLSGYNNYSDIDGQLGTTMTPTEATNGKTVTLSDGVVHQVTSKPVGTTNGEFSAVVSNSVEVNLANSFLLQDNFTGTTISTLNWLEIEQGEANTTVNQDGVLTFTSDGLADASVSFSTYLRSKELTMATALYMTFDVDCDNQGGGGFMLGLVPSVGQPGTDWQALQSNPTETDVKLNAKAGNTNNQEVIAFDIGTVKTVKLVATGTTLDLYYWNTSWVQLGAQITHTLGTGTWYACLGASSSVRNASVLNIDNLVVTDSDFVTQRP